jgi:hypothetical protein
MDTQQQQPPKTKIPTTFTTLEEDTSSSLSSTPADKSFPTSTSSPVPSPSSSTSTRRRAKHVHVTSSPSESSGVVKINKKDGTFEFVASPTSSPDSPKTAPPTSSPDSPKTAPPTSSPDSPASISEYTTHKHNKKSCCSRAGLRIRHGAKRIRAAFRYYFF